MPATKKKGKKPATKDVYLSDDSDDGGNGSEAGASPAPSPARRVTAPTTPRPRGMSRTVSRVFLLRVKEATCLWMRADPALIPDDDEADLNFEKGQAFRFCSETAVVVQGVVTAFCVGHSKEAVERRKLLKTQTSVDGLDVLALWKLYGLDCACKNPAGCVGAVGVDQACCGTCERSFAMSDVSSVVLPSGLTYCGVCDFLKMLEPSHWLVIACAKHTELGPTQAVSAVAPSSGAVEFISELREALGKSKRKAKGADIGDSDSDGEEESVRCKVPKKANADSFGEFYFGYERSKEAIKIGKIHKAQFQPIFDGLAACARESGVTLSAEEDYPTMPENIEQVYNAMDHQVLRLGEWGAPDTGVKDEVERRGWLWSGIHCAECQVQMKVVQREAAVGTNSSLLAMLYGKNFRNMKAVTDSVGVEFGDDVLPEVLRAAEREMAVYLSEGGRAKSSPSGKKARASDDSRPKCYACGKKGHISSVCRNPRDGWVGKSSVHIEPVSDGDDDDKSARKEKKKAKKAKASKSG